MILTADIHLTDKPEDEYRWEVFSIIERQILYDHETTIFILGDLADNKDRHSAELVNRVVQQLQSLVALGKSIDIDVHIHILMGNHDAPLRGTPFWEFLNTLDGVYFYSYYPAIVYDDILVLPWSKNPMEDWAEVDFEAPEIKMILLHQTVTGAMAGNRKLENTNMPALPTDKIIYSGDIHTPQRVGPLTYVGAPHPIKFGDDYVCRILRLDDATYELKYIIDLNPPRKDVIRISSVAELDKQELCEGDQIRIQYDLDINKLEQWAIEQETITKWASERGIRLVSSEVMPTLNPDATIQAPEIEAPSDEILKAFVAAEGLDDATSDVGLLLLKEELGM